VGAGRPALTRSVIDGAHPRLIKSLTRTEACDLAKGSGADMSVFTNLAPTAAAPRQTLPTSRMI